VRNRIVADAGTMKRFAKRITGAAALVIVAACGGGGGSSTPTTPTTPTTPAPQPNRNPVINSVSVNPTFGIATFTTYTFASSASDPDGDSLTYTWDLAGNPRTGASQTIVFVNGGDGSGTVTVSDGKGGSASQSVSFTSATTTGSWTGNIPFTIGPRPMSLTMTQSTTSGATTANWNIPAAAVAGILDPASPNGIDASGRVTLRFKITQGTGFLDFTFTGQMQTSGRSIVGSVSGSGFGGQPVTFSR
jgi:hypothetical protein